MTIKELAEVAGCNEKTVRRLGKELYPTAFKRGVLTQFSKEQCFDIMAELPKRNLVQMSEEPRTNVRSEPTDIDKLVGLVEMLVKTVTQMNPTVTNGNQLVIPEVLPEVTHMTLTGYSRVNNLQLSEGDKRSAGMVLRGICNQRGLIIKPIPDQHYGRVNSYPVEILDEYYTP